MSVFGKRSGGGRRKTGREAVPLLATLTSVSRSHSAILVDISATGARLRGNDLPAVDQDLIVIVENVRSFATARWNQNGQVGVEFDPPLADADVQMLRHEVAKGRGFTPEERAAYEAWKLGVAR